MTSVTMGLRGIEPLKLGSDRRRADLLATLSTWRLVIDDGGEGGNAGVDFSCVEEGRRPREPDGDSDSSSSLMSIPGHT